MAKWLVWNLKVIQRVGGQGYEEVEKDVRAFLESVAKTKDLTINNVQFATTALRGKVIYTAFIVYTTLVRGRSLP
jgi:hypothetical protein